MQVSDSVSRCFAVICALALSGSLDAATAGADTCPHWISVMPLVPDDAAAIVDDTVAQGNETVIDGIAWSCSVHPMGDPVADAAAKYAEGYRQIAPRVRARSQVKQGILLQSTMGHGGRPGQPAPWQLWVRDDGVSPYRMCPLDVRFRDYIAKACRTFSSLKPDFFMIDDDTRIADRKVPGCFCPLHLAAFAKTTGCSWTREEVLAAFAAKNASVVAAWEKLTYETMAGLFDLIRANFEPTIPGILCTVWAPAHYRHAKDFASRLAAPGQVPVVRANGANYAGNRLDHVTRARAHWARNLDMLGPGVVCLQEADTCPQTLWSCSAKREYENMVIQALEGVKGAKIWITRLHRTKERRSQAAYRRLFAENRGIMEWAAKADFRQTGVVLPPFGWDIDDFATRYLSTVGLPYRYGYAKKGDVIALSADTLGRMTRDQIAAALSERVLLDGTAAVWLSENGFADDIGVVAKAWARRTVQSHRDENGVELGGMSVDAAFADLTERRPETVELSQLRNVPYMGAEPQYEAPGALAYRNARGGEVVAFALPLRTNMPVYYQQTMFSESYQAWIARLVKRLSGGTYPGGVRFAGAGAVMCESGETTADGRVFVLDPVDVDDIVEPEMEFARSPVAVERLGGDGVWRPVAFSAGADGLVCLKTVVASKMPAIFRYR